MHDPHVAALFWASTMSERDRRTVDETAGRTFAAMARAVRRLRGRRAAPQPMPQAVPQAQPPAKPSPVFQAETSTR